MKVGIIRCQQTEDMCPASGCLKAVSSATGAFEGMGEVELVGFVTCGGCPGKRAIPRALKLVNRGAEAIAFSSCVFKGTPIDFPCPHAEQMKTAINKKLGNDIKLLEFTHH